MHRIFDSSANIVRLFLFFLLAPFVCISADSWQVPGATVRYTVRLTRRPSHPSAGYFVAIPDGGVLPAPLPEATVVDSNGKIVRSAALWHNRANGLALVFAAPEAAGSLTVYLSPAQRMNLWSPETGIFPGPFLCTDSGSGSLSAAEPLSRLGPVNENVHFQEAVGRREAPLNIGGDLTGRPRPASFYLLAHLMLKNPGKTWIAPFALSGEVRTIWNGQAITPRKLNDKWGGIGQAMNLEEGVQRVEVLAACPGTESFDKGRGVMWMTWRTPGDTVADLGGLRPAGVPYAGTSAWESRVVRSDEIIRSGGARIVEASASGGHPLAMASAKAIENYWKGERRPLFVYQLSALSEKAPEGTRYAWQFDRGAVVESNPALWIFPGATEHKVRLSVKHGEFYSHSTVSFYAYSGVRSRLSSSSTRQNFQHAFVSMLRAYPPESSPAADWSREMWECFMDVQALGEGEALLTDVVLRHWNTFARNLSEKQQSRLQNLFYHFIAWYDPGRAEKWLNQAIESAPGNKRRIELRCMLAELFMYQRQDFSKARNILLPLLQYPGETLPHVRMGDIAFLTGDLNEAARLWSQARDRYSRAGTLGTTVRDRFGERIQPWKREAVLDTRMSMTVINLLSQNLYDQALQELHQWEKIFPHTKISGDYILQEAKLFKNIGNTARARVLLSAYCDHVDASSYLPEAAELLLDCMQEEETDSETIREFAADMKERFRFHPLGQRMEQVLKDIEAEQNRN